MAASTGTSPAPRRSTRAIFGLILLVILAGSAWYVVRPMMARFAPVPFSQTDLGARALLSVSLNLELTPGEELTGTAVLDLAPIATPGKPFVFLLNKGLQIEAAHADGAPLKVERDGELVALTGAPLAEAQRVTVTYRGAPGRSTLAPATVWQAESVQLPPQAFWYPVDLHSFHNLDGSLRNTDERNPGRFVTGGRVAATSAPSGHDWRMPRPVLGAALIWGPYNKRESAFGQVNVTLHGEAEELARQAALAENLRDLQGFYVSRYGPSDLNSIHLVIDPAVPAPWVGWDGTIAVAPEHLACDPDCVLVTLGRLLAQNWWGATATGRWFSPRPEGSAWITRGLAEFSAWRALRHIRGRAASIAYLESLPCTTMTGPVLKAVQLNDARGAQGNAVRRSAFATMALADYVGADAFDEACRNFLAIHRYAPVSYAAFMHELRLASGVDLDEMLLAWFDQTRPFDYALTNVAVAGQRVQMSVENQGSLPAWPDLDIAIIGERGVAMKTVSARPPRTTIEFETNVTAKRVVLDPGFSSPDAARANNVWPRMTWPVSIHTTNAPGAIVSVKSEWCLNEADRFALYDPAQPNTLRPVALPKGGLPHAGPDAERYAAILADWSAAGRLSDKAREAARDYRPVSNIVEHTEDGTLTFFDRDGRYLRMRQPQDNAADLPEVEVVLSLPYPVSRALLSADGQYAAWLDRAGLLRATEFDEPFPRYTAVQGDVLDFQWHEDGSLYALAAVSPRLLPMRYHATYSLWRVDNAAWNSEEVMQELEYRFTPAG